MKAIWLAGIGVAALLASAAGADDRPGKDYAALNAAFSAAWDKADSAAARNKVIQTYREKFLDFATKNPRDPRAAAALCQVVQMSRSGRKDEMHDRALAALRKDHVKGGSPALRKKLKALAGRIGDDEAFAYVREVAAKNGDRTTQAWACQALVKGYEQRIRLAERLEKDRAYRGEVEKVLGAAAARLTERAPDNRLKLRQVRKRLAKQFADVYPDLSVGRPAPELVCEDLDGRKVKLSDLKGKVVVLDFWTTWCGYCIRMIPHERELVKRLKDRPFVLVSISADDSTEKVKRFQERTPMPWTQWYIGANSEVIDTWDIEGYPTILVLDHKGVIRYKDVRDKKMDEAVDTLLEEMREGKE
jgi:thiol-disulfide isomerase/thioredoxin